jgi:hypothetical protein
MTCLILVRPSSKAVYRMTYGPDNSPERHDLAPIYHNFEFEMIKSIWLTDGHSNCAESAPRNV